MTLETEESQARPDGRGEVRAAFRVGLSADFCDEQGQLIFPDIGLSTFAGVPRLSHEFLPEYQAEYSPLQLKDYDVLISLKPKVTAQSLRGVTRLCAIGRCGVGYDNVDLDACTELGIAVYITPGGVVRPVAEAILLFVLALSHRLTVKDRMVRQGRWAESTRSLGREPRDRVVGTIGMGNIAAEAVRLLRTLDVARFVAFDPFANPAKAKELGVELVSLEELLRVSDYVLINCPLTAETRGLIGPPQFAQMKRDAVLINTARGPIVDESALISALQSGQIAGAALDVFEKEPLSSDSPLTHMDNVILSSHSIAWTEELFRDMGRIDCQGALAIYHGDVPNHVVNPEVLTHPLFLEKLARYKAATRKSGISE
jgi:phosphoglycerate dehydrogenase-like enzyme